MTTDGANAPPGIEYLAGFFDGEGSVGLYLGGSRCHALRSQLTQTSTPASNQMFEQLRARWGGSLCEFNKANSRTALNWQVSGETAGVFLRDIVGHLVFKRDQASLAIAWLSSREAPERDERTGRMLPRSAARSALNERVADLLKRMKREMHTPSELEDTLLALRSHREMGLAA